MSRASIEDLVYALTKDMTESDLGELCCELKGDKSMGNRAVITTSMVEDVENSNDIGVYLHWNGGRDSVEAFLTYCKIQGFRCPEEDNYGWARLCQVIANYFGGSGLSVGIDQCCRLGCDNYNNGVYVIKNWEIVDRKYFDKVEQHSYDLYEMLCGIDEAQPKKMQLGSAKIREELRNMGIDYHCCEDEEFETEIEKLDKALTEMNVEHYLDSLAGGYQIFVYDENGDVVWDAICTENSYGYSDGLLEVYGKIVPEKDGVVGFLTAAQVIEMMKKNGGLSMNVVLVKHLSCGQYFLFEVPQDKKLNACDRVLVNTRRGVNDAICICDSFEIDESSIKSLAYLVGASLPLQRVVAKYNVLDLWEDEK